MTSSSSKQPIPTLTLSPERIALNKSLHKAISSRDYELTKKLLEVNGADAWWEEDQEDSMGWSSLHYAAETGDEKIVKLLLRRGAIWNAVDPLGFTAAEIAWSLNHEAAYRAIFDEGVRCTLVLNLLHKNDEQDEEDEVDEEGKDQVDIDGDSQMSSTSDDDNEDDDEDEDKKESKSASNSKSKSKTKTSENEIITTSSNGQITLSSNSKELNNSNQDFLKSKLKFIKDEQGRDRCLDQDDNMVMASWESDIMKRTSDLLCDGIKNPRVLNVGFGLGIIDTFFQEHQPSRHVIIEAHPDAISYAKSLDWDKKPGVEIWQGKWEDFMNSPEIGEFDIIYFDTYSQDYADLKSFFDNLPNLLSSPESKFSFFQGLAGTNQFLYEVFTRVSELDLRDIGLSTEWETIRPMLKEEVWNGVKRKYWDLEEFRIPISKLEII